MNLTVPRILWGALSTSVLLFVVVLAVVRQSVEETPEPVMLIAFGSVSLVMAALSVAMPKVMYQKALAARKLKVVEVPDPEAMRTQHGAPTRRVFEKPEAAKKVALVLFQSPFIVGLAMAESVGTFGLVLGMMGFDWPMVGPFFALSFLLCLARFPRESSITGPLESVHRARLS